MFIYESYHHPHRVSYATRAYETYPEIYEAEKYLG
jgi:hypothetical protein